MYCSSGSTIRGRPWGPDAGLALLILGRPRSCRGHHAGARGGGRASFTPTAPPDRWGAFPTAQHDYSKPG